MPAKKSFRLETKESEPIEEEETVSSQGVQGTCLLRCGSTGGKTTNLELMRGVSHSTKASSD